MVVMIYAYESVYCGLHGINTGGVFEVDNVAEADERFLSDTVRFTSSYLTIEPEKWWAEVASLKDWYSKLQAMKSPYITTEGFAIQFKSHEYYIEEQTIL